MNPWFIAVMLAGASLPIFAPSDNRRLARRIFWQSFVLSATDVVRHPLTYVPALIGAKGREMCCRRCGQPA